MGVLYGLLCFLILWLFCVVFLKEFIGCFVRWFLVVGWGDWWGVDVGVFCWLVGCVW